MSVGNISPRECWTWKWGLGRSSGISESQLGTETWPCFLLGLETTEISGHMGMRGAQDALRRGTQNQARVAFQVRWD